MARIIAFVGGGTMGPTAPLLALQRTLKRRHPNDRFVWAGTAEGPERAPVEAQEMAFDVIPTAKLPRYPSLAWFTWPFDYLRACKAADVFLEKWKPDVVIGAGGFTQVPVIRYASRRGIPCLIHQLDFVPTWSNRAVSKLCKVVTTTFTYHYKKFPNCKDERRIATPNRFVGIEAPERIVALKYFGFSPDKPVLLVMGGGTGARALNYIVERNLDRWLERVQVLQLTGKGRSLDIAERPGYVRRTFLDFEDILHAYVAAEVVISRAGMGAISDLATFSKPTILVPIPNTHQEKNTRHLPVATVEVREGPNLFDELHRAVLRILKYKEDRDKLKYEIHKAIPTDDGSEWADIVERFLPEDLD